MGKDRLYPAFRLATAADADPVSEVYLASMKAFLPWLPQVHTDDEVRKWIRTYLIPTGRVTVALLDHEVVGMMALSNSESNSDDGAVGWIDQLYLQPDVVRRGLGTALLARAKAELGSPIRLYTFQANEGARHFYEHHGFRAIAFGDGSGNEEECPDVLYEWRA